MEENNNIEKEMSEVVNANDRSQLEERIATLTAKRDELSSKMAIARMSNNKTNLYNSLLTLYASVCGLIVDYKAALTALVIGGAYVIAEGIKNGKKVLDDRDDLAAVNQTLTMIQR